MPYNVVGDDRVVLRALLRRRKQLLIRKRLAQSQATKQGCVELCTAIEQQIVGLESMAIIKLNLKTSVVKKLPSWLRTKVQKYLNECNYKKERK